MCFGDRPKSAYSYYSRYDTCWFFTETIELPTRTKAVHVPDPGHVHQAFPGSFPAFFARAPDVLTVFPLCNLNYEHASPQRVIFNDTLQITTTCTCRIKVSTRADVD